MEFIHPEHIVSTSWLADHLDDAGVRILDVTAKLTSLLDNSAGELCWLDGHIPGSLFFDVASANGELSNPDSDLPWMWPTPNQFEATMARFGIGSDNQVFLVARTPRVGVDSGTMWCTRAWWIMHHYGVDCAVLTGGIERWATDGQPLTTKSPAPRQPSGAPLKAATGWEKARATSADVLDAVYDIEGAAGAVCLVDALPVENFNGAEAPYGRAGHINGAINVPFRSLIDTETCGFVEPQQMHRALTEAGLLTAPKVISYCGGAIAATVNAFGLKMLGHENVSVYDGSLLEWAADPDLPMTDLSG